MTEPILSRIGLMPSFAALPENIIVNTPNADT